VVWRAAWFIHCPHTSSVHLANIHIVQRLSKQSVRPPVYRTISRGLPACLSPNVRSFSDIHYSIGAVLLMKQTAVANVLDDDDDDAELLRPLALVVF